MLHIDVQIIKRRNEKNVCQCCFQEECAIPAARASFKNRLKIVLSTITASSVIKQNLTENNMENLLMFRNYMFENIFFNDSIVNYSGAAEPNAQGCAFAHPIF